MPPQLLRSTHTQLLTNSHFSLLLHPLHPCVQVPQCTPQHILTCKKCNCYLNSTDIFQVSLLGHRCLICGGQGVSEFSNGRFVDYDVVDVVKEGVGELGRDLVFVLEANEYVHKKKVVQSIFCCLRALQTQSEQPPSSLNKSISQQTQKSQKSQTSQNSSYYPSQSACLPSSAQSQSSSSDSCSSSGSSFANSLRIGFILFDNSRHYMLNMSNNQLIVINPGEFQGIQEFPLNKSQLVHPLSLINLSQVEQIIQMLMYQAYQLRNVCLLDTLTLCNLIAENWGIQSRLFSLSYDSAIIDYMRNRKKNCEKRGFMLDVSSRVQIQFFSYSLYKDAFEIGLAKNISNFHQFHKLSPTDLYYTLYHTLTQQTHYNPTLKIQTSSLISYCDTTTTSSTSTRSGPHFIQIPVLNSNRQLVLDFGVLGNVGNRKETVGNRSVGGVEEFDVLKNQCVCLEIDFGGFVRKIVYKLPKIGKSASYEPYFLNDQPFFYAMMYHFLLDKKATNTTTKKQLQTKLKQIINKILKIQSSDVFSIPKNLTNFFMYTFMIMQHQLLQKKNTLYHMQKNMFLTSGLETISKAIYPKVYDFYPELRPLKFKPKSFMHDTLRLVDNGRFIGLVIGDEVSSDTLQRVFNVKSVDQVVEWREIPVLETPINQKLRYAVEMLRSMNQLYYLPLKIILFDSEEYEECYGNRLYIDEQHRRFFMQLLKN